MGQALHEGQYATPALAPPRWLHTVQYGGLRLPPRSAGSASSTLMHQAWRKEERGREQLLPSGARAPGPWEASTVERCRADPLDGAGAWWIRGPVSWCGAGEAFSMAFPTRAVLDHLGPAVPIAQYLIHCGTSMLTFTSGLGSLLTGGLSLDPGWGRLTQPVAASSVPYLAHT